MSRQIQTLDRADVRAEVARMTSHEVRQALSWRIQSLREGRQYVKEYLYIEEYQLALLERGEWSGMDINYHVEWLCQGLA